jgi:hypothetical protein
MLLTLVWDRASGSKTLERTFPNSNLIEEPIAESKPRHGFFENLEGLLSAYAKLILKEIEK